MIKDLSAELSDLTCVPRFVFHVKVSLTQA